MDKTHIYSILNSDGNFDFGNIIDNIDLAINIDFSVFSNFFYPPTVWRKLEKIQNLLDVNILLLGLNDLSEKKIPIFFPIDFEITQELMDENIVYFKINGENNFYSLEHKDFLGAIMSIGLKRECFGDLIVKDNIAYCITTFDFYSILFSSLISVGKVPVKISKIKKNSVPLMDFKELSFSVPSFRIDSIVAELGNFSRNESLSKILSGDVLVNYTIPKSKSLVLEINDVITIKKIGKFIFKETLGENKKGKIKVLFLKFS